MSNFRIYKYLTYNKSKILKALFLIAIMLLAIVPVIYLVKFFLPQGTSMSFTLTYDSELDANFDIIDYSGIENEFEVQTYLKYYLDGQLFTTTSNTIAKFLNDKLEHNLTILWGEETYEYIFNSSISQTIALSCKSIEAVVMWEDISVPIDGMTVILKYFDGSNWIDIETIVSDVNGSVIFVGLVMGNYTLDSTEFTLNQSVITYSTEVFIEANKTEISIDYISSITGDTIVDLSTISYSIEVQLDEIDVWYNLPIANYAGMIFDDATGTITIYELAHENDDYTFTYRLILEDYAGIEETYFGITIDGFTQINIDAKNLEAEYLWTFDGMPVVGESFELFIQDGAEWIYVGTYITNDEGKVILTNNLPIGVYKLGQTEFSIIANDITKIVTSTIESLCVKEKGFSLGFCRDARSNFFFFVFKLKIMLTIVFPELLAFGFLSFGNTYILFLYASANSSISLLYGGIKL